MLLLLACTILLPWGSYGAKNLQDVLRVDMRNPNQYYSSCAPHFNLNEPVNSGSHNILNMIWDQINGMNDRVFTAISSAEYNKPENYAVRRLPGSFFAITENQHGDASGDYEYSDDPTLSEPWISYRKKLGTVRSNFKTLRSILNDVQQDDSPLKPRLYCDSTFMEIKNANSNALDADGQPFPLRSASGQITGYEKLPGNVQRKWVTTTDSSGSTVTTSEAILSWTREATQSFLELLAPFLSMTELISLLIAQELMATTSWVHLCYPWKKPENSDTESNYSADDEDDAMWFPGDHIILCPASFQRGSSAPPTDRPADATRLDDLDITAMTLVREFFHLTDYDNDDFDRRMPKVGSNNAPVPEFPDYKEGFETTEGDDINGALECLMLGMWELAETETISAESATTKNCESYAWFSYALLIMQEFGMDCTSGFCFPLEDGAGTGGG